MSSTRINVTNSYSCGRTYGIDRTMPAIMNGRVSEYEWEHFCEQVDNLIVPLNKLQYLLLAGTIAVFVAFFVVLLLSFSSFSSATVDNDSSPTVNMYVFFLIPFGFMMGMLGLSCYVSSKSRRVLDQVRQLCEATSRNNHKVSLHLRDDRLVVGRGYYDSGSNYYRTYHNIYIEASLSDINVVPMVPTTAVVASHPEDLEAGHATLNDVPLAHATTLASEDGYNKRSEQQRMVRLNRIRHLLTEEEYEKKRNEILANI
jgi:hypothetical protein